jgi:hypothetical protein
MGGIFSGMYRTAEEIVTSWNGQKQSFHLLEQAIINPGGY